MKIRDMDIIRFASVLIALFSYNNPAIAEQTHDVKLEGFHYISARSLHNATESFKIINETNDVIRNINVNSDNNEIKIDNPCSAGLLPHTSCKLTYTYTPGKDVGTSHTNVTGSLNQLNINYEQASQKISDKFYVVAYHLDSLRLLTIPTSDTRNHQFPLKNATDIFFDEKNTVIYIATPAGLAISFDHGSSWQTITPFNSTLTNSISTTPVGELEPTSIFVDQNNIYLVLDSVVSGDVTKNLYLSQDRGATWRMVKSKKYKLKVAADGKDIYVATDTLERSSDGGKTWIKLKDNVNDLVINKDTIYISTDSGLFYSHDRGETFQALMTKSNPPCLNTHYCNVDKIKLADNKIYVDLLTNYNEHSFVEIDNGKFNILKSVKDDQHYDFAVMDGSIVIGSKNIPLQISHDHGTSWREIADIYLDWAFLQSPNRLVFFRIGTKIRLIVLPRNNGPMMTDDEGIHWNKIEPYAPTNKALISIASNKTGKDLLARLDGNIGYGLDATHVMSHDNGVTWVGLYNNESDHYRTRTFSNALFGNNKFYYLLPYISEQLPTKLMNSDNDGISWTAAFPKGTYEFYTIKADGIGNLYTLKHGSLFKFPHLYTSSDDGINWVEIKLSTEGIPDYKICRTSRLETNSQIIIISSECTQDYRSNTTELLILKNSNNSESINKKFFGENRSLKSEGLNIYQHIQQGNSELLFISHDGGTTWVDHVVDLHSESRYGQKSLLGVRNGIIYLAAKKLDFRPNSDIYLSADDGASWNMVGSTKLPSFNNSINQEANDLAFSDDSIFIASGAGLFNLGYPEVNA